VFSIDNVIQYAKKSKINLVCGNFVKNICKKALRFQGVSVYQYDSL
jgi:hypothetical protein